MVDNKSTSTKMRIVECAVSLYKEHGYHNITVKDICNCCGLTRSAFYYHFNSKDEILDDYFLPSDTFAFEQLAPVLSSNNYVQQFYSLINLYLERIVESGPEIYRQIMKRSIDHDIDILMPTGIKMRTIYESILQKAQESGQILNTTPVTHLVDSIVHISNGISLVWCNKKGSFDLITENHRMLDSLLMPSKG